VFSLPFSGARRDVGRFFERRIHSMIDRRTFLQSAAKTAAFAGAATRIQPLLAQPSEAQAVSPNDTIRLALIGAGIQGQGDTKTAIQVPGVKLVAVADCYDGRLTHAKGLSRDFEPQGCGCGADRDAGPLA
jgi:ornithine cyclodeaminase/alanine dehydrogenase-like protein (mu-crystallin family)